MNIEMLLNTLNQTLLNCQIHTEAAKILFTEEELAQIFEWKKTSHNPNWSQNVNFVHSPTIWCF